MIDYRLLPVVGPSPGQVLLERATHKCRNRVLPTLFAPEMCKLRMKQARNPLAVSGLNPFWFCADCAGPIPKDDPMPEKPAAKSPSEYYEWGGVREGGGRKRTHEAEKAGEKVCTHCLLPKPYGDFYTNSSKRDGYQSWCKQCVKGGVSMAAPRLKEDRRKLKAELKELKKFRKGKK